MENKIHKNAPSKFQTLVCENAHLVVTPESGIDLPYLTKDENGGADSIPEYDGKFKCWAIVARIFRNTDGSIVGAIDYLRKHVRFITGCSLMNHRPYDDAIYYEVNDMFDSADERPNLTTLFEIIQKYVGENISRKEFNKIVKKVKALSLEDECPKEDIYIRIAIACVNYAEEKERPLVEQTIQKIKAKYNLDEIQEPYWNLEEKINDYKWAV